MENLKDALLALAKYDCMDYIYRGFDDDAKGEMLHYTLSEQHQKDMEAIMAVVDEKPIIYWRDNSRVMYEEYTQDEFKHLHKSAQIYKTINKIYSDGLEDYILSVYADGQGDIDLLHTLKWGVELPEAIRAEVDTQVMAIERIDAETLRKFKEDRGIEI